MAKQGFSQEQLMQSVSGRSQAFAEARKNRSRGWLPPVLNEGEDDYLAELVESALLPSKKGPPIMKWTFQCVEDRPDEDGGTIHNKKFSIICGTSDEAMGVLDSYLAAVYGTETMPEDPGLACVGCQNFTGNIYKVAVRPGKGDFPKRAYINGLAGKSNEIVQASS